MNAPGDTGLSAAGFSAVSAGGAPRRYRLIAEIGRGGMAEVYLAVAQGPGGFNKLVVIKKALRDLALQPDILAMFQDEARLAARMNHPNVVQTYELGEEDDRQFIAMEYLDGQPYSRVLTRMRAHAGGLEAMSLAHHLRVLLDTLAGLHHAHELRDFDGTPLYVVHRDATPQNVFITYDGSIKVVDFGIAKAQDSSSRTVTGEIKGKITYMSPEQVRGEPLDRRADLFAIGVMLWEAIAGRRMWRELPDMTILNELLQGRVPSLREAAPHAPPELVSICERALGADREARYPSALAMHRELEHFAVTSGMRTDGPEVGRLVSEWFDAERQRVRALVEKQLGSLRWTGEHPGSSGSLPLIPTPPTSFSGSGLPGPKELSGDFGVTRASLSGIPTNSGAAMPMPPAPAGRRSTVVLFAGALVAAVLVAVVVMKVFGPSDRSASSGAAPSGERGPVAPASLKSESVSLKVRATPSDAKIYLDDALLGAGSFDGKVVRSDAPRKLRIEAEGYVRKEESIVLTSDLMTSFALEKTDGGAPATSASASTTPGVPYRPGGPRPRPTGRPIDSESPYKTP